MTLVGASDESPPAGIDAARAALEKWVETRRIISQEKREWELGAEMLAARIDLVQREIDTLRQKMGEAEASITETQDTRTALASENEALNGASASLEKIAANLEERTKQLLRQLPDPIREHVKPLSQRLPDDRAQMRLSLSERFQNLVGILNEINKFNREITVVSEVRTLPDGSSVEVAAMYVGIGQGYYVGGNGTVAGVGRATPDGWTWTPANHAAPQIARAIAIFRNEEVAGFVRLPFSLD